MLVKPDIASATEKHFAQLSCGKMSSKRGIGYLGDLNALLMVFDGSKQITNLSFVSLTVMLLHQAVGCTVGISSIRFPFCLTAL